MTNPMPDITDDERYVSLIYAATFLGCSRAYLDGLIKSGRLPSYRLGSRGVRLKLTDLHALIVPVPGRAEA